MKSWRQDRLIPFEDKELTHYTEKEEKAFSVLEWSETPLGLSKLVKQYILPQIVRIEDGYYSQEEDSSLSSGQILKIHCVKTVRKLAGLDQYGKEVHVPLNTTTKVILRPENFRVVYETVNDLAHAKPVPKFVEVTRGYFNPKGLNGDNIEDLTVDPGEVLEVVRPADHQLFSRPSQEKYMVFKNSKGEEFKLPYGCSPGFRSLLEKEQHLLGEIVNNHKLPIFASFAEESICKVESFDTQNKLAKFGVIQFNSFYDEELIVASCGHESVRVIFTIPKDIDVTVKVAKGALTNDPEYTGLCQGYNNYKRIEELTIKRYERDIYRRSGEVRGYEYCLRSAGEGQFIDMEGESDEYDSDDTHCETIYVYNDTAKSSGKSVGTDKKKTLTLPYEVTDINVTDFRKGGKYFEHLSESKDDNVNGYYDLQGRTSDMCHDGQPVKLVRFTSLDQTGDDLPKPLVDIGNKIGKLEVSGDPNKALYDESGYLKSVSKNDADKSTMTQKKKADPNNSVIQSLTRPPSSGSATSTEEKHVRIKPTLPKPFVKKDVPPKPPPKSPAASVVINPDKTAPENTKILSAVVIEENTNKRQTSATSFQIPYDLSKMSSAEVCSCLLVLNLGHLKEVFVKNQINGDLLVSLEDDDYKDLQLTNFERKKMMRFVQGWRPDNADSRS
eukprot:gene7255-12940_t